MSPSLFFPSDKISIIFNRRHEQAPRDYETQWVLTGQLQKPVELLKNYPNINLFVGVSFLDQHRDAIGRALSTNCLYKQGYIKLLSRIHYPHLA